MGHGTPVPLGMAETAVLGADHAAEHAAIRTALRRQRAAWRRLPAARRARIVARARVEARAYAASTAAEGFAHEVGRWTVSETPITLPTWAINAVLLPTGKILMWGREPVRNGKRGDRALPYLWDPAHPAAAAVPMPLPMVDVDGDGDQEEVPLFCSGQSLLPDGQVLAAGGTLAQWKSNAEGWKGLNMLVTFDPWSETWTLQNDRMDHGRWYPTQAQLPDGRIGIVAGLDETGMDTHNRDFELFTPAPQRGGQGTVQHMTAGDPHVFGYFGLYPHLHVMRNGKLALGGPGGAQSGLLDPTALGNPSRSSAWQVLPRMAEDYRGLAAGVALPGGPGGPSRLAVIGGAVPEGTAVDQATDSVIVLDSEAPLSGWDSTGSVIPPLSVGRNNENTVILPDGSLLTVGGGAGFQNPGGDVTLGPGHSYTNRDPELKRVELLRAGSQPGTWTAPGSSGRPSASGARTTRRRCSCRTPACCRRATTTGTSATSPTPA